MSNLSKVKRIQLNCSIRQLKEYCENNTSCVACVFYTRFLDTHCQLKKAPLNWSEIEENKEGAQV